MELTTIPGLDSRVSRISLGTWAIGGWMWGGTEERQSIETIHAALDKGVTLLDTAPVYGFGTSERIVGKALAEYENRGKVRIATKCGLNWDNGQVFRDARAERIAEEIDQSLERLGVQHIDVYFVHWPDPRTPMQETAGAMRELHEQGLIKAIGVSNFSSEQMEEFRQYAPLHVCQPPYNIFERGIEQDVMPYCKKHGITLMTYGALCRGLLSGKLDRDRKFTGDDLRKVDPKFQQPRFDQYLEAVNRLFYLAREHYDHDVLSLAVRWVLDHGSNIAIWGGRSPKQMESIEGVLHWNMDEKGMREVDRIVEMFVKDPVGPEFMAPPARQERAA